MNLICGLVVAVMALFPSSAGEGGLNLGAWMDAYEKHLYTQMAENFEREERERNAEICQNPSESEVSIEQTASEEEQESHDLLRTDTQNACEIRPENTEAPEEQTEVETSDAVPLPTVVQTPLFSVNGAVLSEEIQVFLFQKLSESNLAYFMPYAMLICYQESKLDIYAENPNGRDKGLLQYRVEYVPWMDWRNPYQQIEYFVAQMANRAAAGCTVSEMISRHNTSDYGEYSPKYVAQVMQWANVLVQIR